jgi:peptidoglycan/xylan/chitin deacetylase (PgdA/CDA1 family)
VLHASRRVEVLEALRIAYEPGACPSDPQLGRLQRAEGGPALVWPEGVAAPAGAYRVGHIPLFARVLADEAVDRLLDATGLLWRRELDIVDSDNRVIGALRRAEEGSVFLPFDPDDAVQTLLRETYLALTTPRIRTRALALVRAAYYRTRPLLPRTAQMALRRSFAGVQEHASFPDWPVEPALHDLCDLLLQLVDEVAGESVPRLSAWPTGKTWALVLTHDVERAAGYRRIDSVLDIERRWGLRSAWFFVPERDYQVEDTRVRALVESGCEVGVHGLHHDGRDLSPGEIARRLPAMQAWAERWGAAGFRAPATHRSWEVMSRLRFDYDSSYSDVARYEPQAGGSCSWLPFLIDGLVELPITLPMDHTLFDLLTHGDGGVWHEKASILRAREGMALMLTHPDYLVDTRLREYERFLEAFAGDETVWHALPREVSAWWRRRAASRIICSDGGWTVEGPAADEARIELGAPALAG